MMEFKTLETVPPAEILESHNDAFSEYEVPMNLSLPIFQHSNKRRGVRYDLSIGAFQDEKLIGFVLNGIDEWNGVLTAYDCGTGVIQAFQGQKIAPALFKQLIPLLLDNKIPQYLLEVIKTNAAALKLYSKMGFKITREFDCVVVAKKDMKWGTLEHPDIGFSSYKIKEIIDPDWSQLQKFWDFPPSWQNSPESITRTQANFVLLGVYHENLEDHENRLIGYGVVEPRSGGITQLAIHPDHRRKKLGLLLLQQLQEKCPKPPKLHFINIDMRMTSLLKFCEAVGFQSFTTQYEMIKRLE